MRASAMVSGRCELTRMVGSYVSFSGVSLSL